MRILSLIMKGEYFNAVLDGEKKKETREIRPKSMKKYCVVDDKGDYVDVRPYDAIQMHLGYNKDRPSLLVRVLHAEAFITADPDTGKDIEYTEGGKTYVQATIDYDLGDIIARENC